MDTKLEVEKDGWLALEGKRAHLWREKAREDSRVKTCDDDDDRAEKEEQAD